jgi:hypothetical protein
MLIGLFLGYFIFTCMSWLIRMSFGIAAAFALGDGWIVTNWLGMFVLLSIFVLAHLMAAITSFRMIALVPHHVPRLIGFSAANRVDMDDFAQGAALIGTQEALTTLSSTVDPKRLASGSSNSGSGQGGQMLLGAPAKGNRDASSTKNGQTSRMDTTLQATTDMGGGRPEAEDD